MAGYAWPLRAELYKANAANPAVASDGVHAVRELPESRRPITACAVVVGGYDFLYDDPDAYPVTCRACMRAVDHGR